MGGLLPTCFVISGATSLILQVVWVRKLVEIFGSSTLAIATVLAAFMGGLALGAAWGGRLADRLEGATPVRDPLLYYGLAELLVGLSALAIPTIIALFRGPNAWLWSHLADTPSLLAICRFGLTALALLVPTTAMGATLPLLVRRVSLRASATPSIDRLGRWLGILYAANTLGAVLGASAAGFLLIPAVGAASSGHIAATGAIGLAALVIGVTFLARARTGATDEDLIPAPVQAPRRPVEVSDRWLALAAYALSGAVAMALEVLFSRALAIVNGSSVTSFTLVLVVFLAGISLGAVLISSRADRTEEPMVLLGWLLAAAAAAITLAVWLTDKLPTISAVLLEGGRLEPGTIVTVHFTITALTIAPVAICLGAIMPVAIAAYASSPERVGRDVGRAYAANTVGAIAGSVLAGFVLMPALTIEHSLRLLAVLDAAMALALILRSRGVRPLTRPRVAPMAIIGAIIALAVFAPRWNRSDFTAGLFRTHIARNAIRAGGLSNREVPFYRDGTATTVTVERLGSEDDPVVVLKNNGKVEASSRVDMPTQILVGLLPVLLHPERAIDSLDVFVVGYGSGVTVGAITQAPGVARVDVAELEPAVYEAADRFFSEVNHAPQDNQKVHRMLGDGRNVLLAGGRSYDVIVSEPSNPWIAGVASLFTREFYAFARDHLKPSGIFCQWAQLYELGPANVKMIYRTFSEAFPYVYAFTPGDEVTDTILIGALEPVDLSPLKLATLIGESDALRGELLRADVARAEDLIAAAFLLPDELAAFTAGAMINTDDNAALEYRAPRDLLASGERLSFARRIRSSGWPYGDLARALAADATTDLEMARALLSYGRRRQARAFLDRARAGASASEIEALSLVLELSGARDFSDPELSIVIGGAPLPTPSIELFKKDGERGVKALLVAYPLVADGRWADAYKALESLPARASTDAGDDITLLLGYLAYKSVSLTDARDLLRPLAEHARTRARRPAALYYLGRSLYGLGGFRAGVNALSDFADEFPALARQATDGRLPGQQQ